MKRVVGALNPKLDGFEASCFDGDYITGDVSADEFAAMAAQRSAPGRRGRRQRSALAPGAAERGRGGLMAEGKIPRVAPAGRRPARHARRARRAAAERLGRELGGAVPHQQLRPARRRHRRGALRQRGRGVHLFALHQPDGDDVRAPPGRARGHRGLHRHLERHERDPAARHGLAEGRRPRRSARSSVFGSTVMLFGREFAKFGVETTFVSQTDVGAMAGARCGRTRSCSSPSRRPTR